MNACQRIIIYLIPFIQRIYIYVYFHLVKWLYAIKKHGVLCLQTEYMNNIGQFPPFKISVVDLATPVVTH